MDSTPHASADSARTATDSGATPSHAWREAKVSDLASNQDKEMVHDGYIMKIQILRADREPGYNLAITQSSHYVSTQNTCAWSIHVIFTMCFTVYQFDVYF